MLFSKIQQQTEWGSGDWYILALLPASPNITIFAFLSTSFPLSYILIHAQGLNLQPNRTTNKLKYFMTMFLGPFFLNSLLVTVSLTVAIILQYSVLTHSLKLSFYSASLTVEIEPYPLCPFDSAQTAFTVHLFLHNLLVFMSPLIMS